MQTTLTRLYASRAEAESAIHALEAAGIATTDLSLVSHHEADGFGAPVPGPALDGPYADEVEAEPVPHDTAHDAGVGASTGASLGTVLGGGLGLLAGIGILAIPGIGPVIGAGWLVATLTGAGFGAGAGGLVGALTGAGLHHDAAHAHGEALRRGGALISVRGTPEALARIEPLLESHDPLDWEREAAHYRSAGWLGFNHAAEPLSPAELAAERDRRRTLLSHD